MSALELALARFDGENTAVERYAAARDDVPYRSAEPPAWTRKVGFVERHHNGRLILRGTFAGHYVDVDEGDTSSQHGAGEGAAAGGLIGVLGGPPGIAVGLIVGGLVGAHLGAPDNVETEPAALASQVRDVVPRGSSALVMIAAPAEVQEMLGAVGDEAAGVTRRPLTDEETNAIEGSLRDLPGAGGG